MIAWYIVVFIIFLLSGLRVIKEWEEAVILRFGKYSRNLKPGLRWIIPIVERSIKVDIRERSFDLKPQEILTKDNVPVKVDAVVFYRVKNTKNSVIQAQDWREMTNEQAKALLREFIGEYDLTSVLEKRQEIADKILEELDKPTDVWGIDITSVKITDVILPDDMKRAMARVAEAEREKNARIIKASGEFEASKQLQEAAKQMMKNPAALKLRELQTLQEIGQEHNTLIIVTEGQKIDPVALSALGKVTDLTKKKKK